MRSWEQGLNSDDRKNLEQWVEDFKSKVNFIPIRDDHSMLHVDHEESEYMFIELAHNKGYTECIKVEKGGWFFGELRFNTLTNVEGWLRQKEWRQEFHPCLGCDIKYTLEELKAVSEDADVCGRCIDRIQKVFKGKQIKTNSALLKRLKKVKKR